MIQQPIKYRGYSIAVTRKENGLANFDISRERLIAAGIGRCEEVVEQAKRLIDVDFITPILLEIQKISKSEGQSFSR